MDQPLDRRIRDNQFMNAHPPRIALLAMLATHRRMQDALAIAAEFPAPCIDHRRGIELSTEAILRRELCDLSVCCRVRLLAFPTETLREPLGENADQRIGERELIEPDIQQPHDAFGGTVGVKCREYEVSR